MAPAPDGKTLASAGIDRSVRLWTLAAAEPRARTMIKGDSYVYTVAYSPDGKQLAAGYHLGVIRLLDPVSGRETGVLKDNPTYVTRVAFTPDNRRLLAASGKETLLWDVSRRKEVLRFKTHETYINDLALSPDGRHAVTATGTYLLNAKGEIVVKDGRNQFTDCTLRLWDVASGELLQAAKGFSDPFQCVAFFPDSKQIASGSGGYDTATRFWSLQGETLNETRTFKGTSSAVQLLAVSPDGRRLVTMGPDGKLIEWDLATGKRLWEWAPEEYVHSLTFAADSRHVAVSLGTGPVYVLRLAPPAK